MHALKPTEPWTAAVPVYNVAVIGFRSFYNAYRLKKLNPHIFMTFLTVLVLAAGWIPLVTLTAAHPYCWAWFAPLLLVSIYALPAVWLAAQRRYMIAAVNARQIFTDTAGVKFVYDYTQ